MTKTIELIFDFGSPNAYLAYKALPPILARTGANLVVTPCLLGGIFKLTGNQPPLMAFAGVKGKMAYEMLEMQRFIAHAGLHKFKMNPYFPINTLTLMRGLVAVGAENATYIDAVLAGMWEDELPMGEEATFRRVLEGAGLDAAAILQKTQDDLVKQRLAANTSHAVERGVFGIPTIFVGDDMFFGKDRLPQVEACLMGG
jgi:2-hydroxychromene-2-carboxylate isomerase